MDRIAILPESLVNQIAAGEVIERPASVVKELVENSLDAGATRVDVQIADGGTRAISVHDDGCGMSEVDAALAFRRHATSKIRCLEDLSKVSTLGFRGEGLPSIASVGRVRLRTRRAQDPIGVEVSAAAEERVELRPSPCAAGTRIEVAELFHAVPARRKFLKSASTEALHIVRWLEEIALVRPDVRIALERDGRSCLALLPTENLHERVISVLPPRLGESMRQINFRTGAGHASGFASGTDVVRGSTNDVHLFVNGRPVRDRVLLSAVREAYRDALPSGRYPALVLYLAVAPEDVDANVHPTKSEVRFRDSRAIHQLVREAISRAVAVRSGPRSSLPAARSSAALLPAHAWLHPAADRVADASLDAGAFGVEHGRETLTWINTELASVSPAPVASAGRFVCFREHRFVGQLFGTYLVLERGGAFVLLDQHAAHERVLFEQLRRGVLAGRERLQSQALLVPVWLELSRSAAEALDANRELLAAAGFEVDSAGPTLQGSVRMAVRSVPALLRQLPGRAAPDFAALLEETASGLVDPELRGEREGIEGAVHHLLATAACHSAVRKGDRMLPEEVHALLAALDEHIEFANCPHGRPIAWTVEEREVARHFLRPIA